MSRYANAFRLIGIGLSAWTLAVAGCGLALGFWTLALCRMLVGVGEASFVALASPFIGVSIAVTLGGECALSVSVVRADSDWCSRQ